MTDDDRAVKLVEEIRDLERQQLATYRTVLRSQEEALRAQKEWRSAATRRVGVFGVLLAVVLVLFLLRGLFAPVLMQRIG